MSQSPDPWKNGLRGLFAENALGGLPGNPIIALLQAMMRMLGFNGQNELSNTGPVDGKAGDLTKGALGQFKQENNLPADANDLDVMARMKQQLSTPEARAKMEETLRNAPQDTVSEDVRAVQTYLKGNGMNVDIDGRMSSQTMAAFHAYNVRNPAVEPVATPVVVPEPSPAPLQRVIYAAPGAETQGVEPADPRSVTAIVIDPAMAPVSTVTVDPVVTDMGGDVSAPAPEAAVAPVAAPPAAPAAATAVEPAKPNTSSNAWWERGYKAPAFNQAAAQGWPFRGPTTAVQPVVPQLGNNGGFLGTGVHFSVNSRGQWNVRARL